MTLGRPQIATTRWLEELDQLLSRRWVQATLFVVVLWLAWSLPTRTAHAAPPFSVSAGPR